MNEDGEGHQYLGSTSNGYTFLDEIGKGNEGDVFRVYSQRYESTFAAKVKHNLKINPLDSLELAAMQAVGHPHVIRFYDYFQNGGDLVLIYELCDGGTLLEEMAKTGEGMKRERFLLVAAQLVSAVRACHLRRVSHRDIKPNNIFWRDRERSCARLGDFGCARMGGGQSRSRCGSPLYMAPELFEGREAIDPFACDVWSLGVTFAEMLVGKELWGEEQRAVREARMSRPMTDDSEIARMLSLMLQPVETRATIEQIAALPVLSSACPASSWTGRGKSGVPRGPAASPGTPVTPQRTRSLPHLVRARDRSRDQSGRKKVRGSCVERALPPLPELLVVCLDLGDAD